MIRRHDAAEVAELIGKSREWLRKNVKTLPHSRVGRTYFWTDADLDALFAQLQVRPAASKPVDPMRPISRPRRAS